MIEEWVGAEKGSYEHTMVRARAGHYMDALGRGSALAGLLIGRRRACPAPRAQSYGARSYTKGAFLRTHTDQLNTVRRTHNHAESPAAA